MAYPLPKEKRLTPDEFETLQMAGPDQRYEFHDGKEWEMEGTTIRHNRIVRNISAALDSFFLTGSCFVVTENVRLAYDRNRYQYYPDMMVVCNASGKGIQVH